MRKNLSLILAVVAVAIPLLVLGYVTLTVNYARITAPTWEISIRGYDPRDLLRGRFIRYQYDWNWATGANTNNKNDCLCLNKNPETGRRDPVVTAVDCAAETRQSCAARINAIKRGLRRSSKRFGQSGQQYYIPEEYADYLDDLFRRRNDDDAMRFSIELAVTDNGRAHVKELLINGDPLHSFLAKTK